MSCSRRTRWPSRLLALVWSRLADLWGRDPFAARPTEFVLVSDGGIWTLIVPAFRGMSAWHVDIREVGRSPAYKAQEAVVNRLREVYGQEPEIAWDFDGHGRFFGRVMMWH